MLPEVIQARYRNSLALFNFGDIFGNCSDVKFTNEWQIVFDSRSFQQLLVRNILRFYDSLNCLQPIFPPSSPSTKIDKCGLRATSDKILIKASVFFDDSVLIAENAVKSKLMCPKEASF